MRIRLRGRQAEEGVSARSERDGAGGRIALASQRLSHRQFLKTVAAAVGLAGLGPVAANPQGAEAADGTFDNLTVAETAGFGTGTPTGRIQTIPLGNLNSGTAGEPPDPANAGLLVGSTSNGLAFDGNQMESIGGPLYVNFNSTGNILLAYSGSNVGIGTATPTARLSIVQNGASQLSGSAASSVLCTSAGLLGDTAGSELTLASIGFRAGNSTSLGIRGLRAAAGSDWTSTAIGLGMDVDNTVRAGAGLWLHANDNVGIGTSTPEARLHLASGAIKIGARVIADSGGSYYA